jgi:hypothetical protein
METLGFNPVEAGLELPPPLRTRRRRVRQKVHTPAYASLNGKPSGQTLDLSEIVDISEEGMAIQTSSPLQVQRSVNLCLDLVASRTCIHTTGEVVRVVWSDRSGRVGIRFSPMPEDTLGQLKEWLFVNLMIACVNHRADLLSEGLVSNAHMLGDRLSVDHLSQVAAQSIHEKTPQDNALVNWMRRELEPTVPADYTSILTALAAVKREVESLGSDLDQALQLLARRSLTFTRASGAAIALTEGWDMICRATAGQDAPGVGARLTVGSGFSGECVRAGRLLSCEDSETDPVVDRESCRALGIRSMIAAPVRSVDAVIGLLEAFSPEPFAFSSSDSIAIERLAGICSFAVHRAGTPEPASGEEDPPQADSRPSASPRESVPSTVGDALPVETAAHPRLPHFSRSRKIILAAALATIVFAAYWRMSPRDFNESARSSLASQQPAKPASNPSSALAVVAADSLEGMRQLAQQGDPAAQFSVGARYATGEDGRRDYAEAVRWFSMAAEHGHVVSQATLGAYYWAGRGVHEDLVKAYFWSVLAQAGGDEASRHRLVPLASRMSPAQIAAAQQQADDWIKEHQSLGLNSAGAR